LKRIIATPHTCAAAPDHSFAWVMFVHHRDPARARRNQNSEYLAQRRKALSFRPKGEIFPRSLASARDVKYRSATRSFFQDNFFSKLSTIRQQSPPESAYANSLKGMRIHRDGSLAHAEGWEQSQYPKTSLSAIGHIAKCLRFYSGRNYDLGWGSPLGKAKGSSLELTNSATGRDLLLRLRFRVAH